LLNAETEAPADRRRQRIDRPHNARGTTVSRERTTPDNKTTLPISP